MKKFFYILSIALLGATSCSVNELGQPESVNNNGKVTFVMGLEFPEVFIATRGAMSENPIIDDVHVAVFGNEGYLNEYVKAVPCNAQGVEQAAFTNIQNGVLFYYKVTLVATTGYRAIHVIANGPDQIQYNSYDYEVMPTLYTTKGNGAYWTMFELPTGTAIVDPQTSEESASPAAKAAFSNLKLIRNFAKVNVTESADNFVLDGYEVFNTPDKGRIVTWMEDYNASNERLAGYYTPYVGSKTEDPMTFAELQTAGYTPSLVDGAQIDPTVPTADWTYTNATKFVFERLKTNAANRPYIIVKGRFNGSTTSTFYRLDFTDKDGNYIPIFRNFQYNIEIKSVAKVGVANPADAQPSNANVSALITTANLTDLADGTSRILVQYIDKTFITSGDVKFQYIYMRDATKPIAQENVTDASFRILTNQELQEEGKEPNTDDPAFTSTGTTTWNSTDKWQEITLTIAAVGDDEKRTTFRIEGQTADGDKLYRDVTIHVLAKQNFSATYTSGGNAIGNTVTVSLTLPDNLPSSVFPLQIAFEDSNKRLNPNSTDMPAQVGTSIVTGKTDRSYQFVKSVSYSEYTTNHVIPCVFKRIATGETTLYMENEYFNKPYSINIGAN
jgi:hypothetical protein